MLVRFVTIDGENIATKVFTRVKKGVISEGKERKIKNLKSYNKNIKQINFPQKVIRGLLEKYPTFGREKETGLLGALDT